MFEVSSSRAPGEDSLELPLLSTIEYKRDKSVVHVVICELGGQLLYMERRPE